MGFYENGCHLKLKQNSLVSYIYIERELYRKKVYYPVMKLDTPKKRIIPLESPLSIKIPALETLDTNIITLQKKKTLPPTLNKEINGIIMKIPVII